jgi:DNA-binding transcriptional ArsR family regulator
MADIHKALSNHIRLAIMQILFVKDRTVNQIIEIIQKEYEVKNMDRTNISKHLGILKNLGIISCISEGQKRIYHLDAKCLMNAIECTLDVIKR